MTETGERRRLLPLGDDIIASSRAQCLGKKGRVGVVREQAEEEMGGE